MEKYDDARWHANGKFPADQPLEHSATHIALFLKWCLIKGWAGDMHVAHHPEEVQQVIDGEMSAFEFLSVYCCDRLTAESLNDAGNAFAKHYYGDDGLYLIDYATHFKELAYTAPEQAHDFAKFSALLDERLASGVLTKTKPWWKLW